MLKRGIDLGGSQTRIATRRKNITSFASIYQEISVNSPVKTFITDPYSDFIIEQHPLEALKGRRFVRDEAMDQYQGRKFVCDNQSNKVEQETIYVNATYAIARDMVSNHLATTDVEVGVCIPTAEFYSDEKKYPDIFKQCMAGKHSVYFPLLNKRVIFTCSEEDTKVFPEGVVAAFKFKTDKNFVEGITLIVDVGYRSTDITVLKRFKPVGKSAVSRPKGGINIEAVLLAELERDNILVSREDIQEVLSNKYVEVDGEYHNITSIVEDSKEVAPEERISYIIKELATQGISVNTEQVAIALKSNYIKHENIMRDVTRQVVTAKKNFASSIKADINDVLATQMMNIGTVNNIMPIGRPFEGDLTNENSLASILCAELGSNLRYYSVPNLATANVEEIIGVMTRDEAAV